MSSDIVEKEDCLKKGKFTDKQNYDLKRFFAGGEIKITENLELYDIDLNCLENEVASSPEQLSDDLPVSTEPVQTSKDDLLEYLKKHEQMYTTSGSKKGVEKSKIFLSSTLKEFDLEEVKGYKAQEKILQDYSTAFYKEKK